MGRDGSNRIYGKMTYGIYMGYPYIRVCAVFTVCHLSRYTGLHIWFLHGEHGEDGALREPSRHPVATTLRVCVKEARRNSRGSIES